MGAKTALQHRFAFGGAESSSVASARSGMKPKQQLLIAMVTFLKHKSIVFTAQ